MIDLGLIAILLIMTDVLQALCCRDRFKILQTDIYHEMAPQFWFHLTLWDEKAAIK